MGSILIVDDNAKLCESLAKNFVQYGYDVLSATNSQKALEILSSKQVSVILLDIMLGDESGIDLLNRVQILNQNIPVIIITGYASLKTASDCMHAGAADFLKKPFSISQIKEVVEKQIQV